MSDRRLLLAALAAIVLSASISPAAVIPRTPDDLAITLPGGKQVKLSQYKGKVVAVMFILTDCGHCQNAVQCLIDEQKRVGSRGFQAIASAIEENMETTVPEFIRRFNPPFPVGYSGLKPSMDFMQHPPRETPHMPLVAFIDRRGVLRAQYEGKDPFFLTDHMARNIHDEISRLLGPRPSAQKKAPKTAAPSK